jgi:hypothetical protein
LKIAKLDKLGFWRNPYFQIEEQNKIKGKEKRGDLTNDLY